MERLEYLIKIIQFKINSFECYFPSCVSSGLFLLPLPALSLLFVSLFQILVCLHLSLGNNPTALRTRCYLQGSEGCGILWLTPLLICSRRGKTTQTGSTLVKHVLHFNSTIFWRKQMRSDRPRLII